MTLDKLPSPAEKSIAVYVNPVAARAIRGGHPWVFENSIEKRSDKGHAGDVAVLFDGKRRFLGVGLLDPDSPICVKVLHYGSPARIGSDFFRQKLEQAVTLRSELPAQGTTGYRVVHGESDGLPSLIVDRYDNVLVVKLYSRIWLPHLRDIVDALQSILQVDTIVLRLSRNVQDSETFGLADGMVLQGSLAEPRVAFAENGLKFVTDVIHGHKTGFFFDQRDNRMRVGDMAASKRVLDVFSYNGGFSLYAAAGGAKSVLSVDISQPALDDAKALFELNHNQTDIQACDHQTWAVDAFEGIGILKQQGKFFGLVIVDPPSFAQAAHQVDGALVAYKRLARLALNVIEHGGLLVMASCSSRVRPEQFYDVIEEAAAQERKRLNVIERTGHAVDHPVIETFPEGRYLKCLFAEVY